MILIELLFVYVQKRNIHLILQTISAFSNHFVFPSNVIKGMVKIKKILKLEFKFVLELHDFLNCACPLSRFLVNKQVWLDGRRH